MRGEGLARLDRVTREYEDVPASLCQVLISDDHGQTWAEKASLRIRHARPFKAGNRLYVIGHDGDLAIAASDDDGDTWSPLHRLSEGQFWHQAPCNVCYANGRIYLVMERNTDPAFTGWCPSRLAPVVMAGRLDDDLCNVENWIFSNEITFPGDLGGNLLGVPFWPVDADPETPRYMAPPGWLESNIVQFRDPNHIWFDPQRRTFYLWMRAHTGSTNLACIARAVHQDDDSIRVSLPKAPSGQTMLFVPCPGGHMKFHILYDETTQLYWLISTQSTDSMRPIDSLPDERYNLPNNQRSRLALHFSRNCMDWCFAGLIARGGSEIQSRHYAAAVIDGEDMHVVSRSGDHRSATAHNGNLITFHTVCGFRELVY
jgi:hypothetical protein